MQADFKVVLDACVLANAGVCDLFLRLAEPPRLFLPLWSEQILKEVNRTQTEKLKHPYSPELAEYWREQVTRAFPEAVVRGYEPLLPVMTNQEKDRHVVAAAVKGGASLIVTFNLRDFPANALQPWEIEACPRSLRAGIDQRNDLARGALARRARPYPRLLVGENGPHPDVRAGHELPGRGVGVAADLAVFEL